MSFNDWREERLVDICDLISRGITPSYTDDKNEGVIVINQKCIRDNCINLDLARLTNPNKKKIADNKYLKLYDILVNSTGVGTLGRVAQVKKLDEKITVDSHVTIVRAKKEIHPVFLGYNLFMNERYIEYLGEGSTGQTELSRIRLGEALKVKLPPIEEQKAIANILSTLDDKIEVNNKINQKLEEMAQTIFKQWFIDFDFPNEEGKPYKSSGGEMVESVLGMIPKGWQVKELGQLSNIVGGGTPSTKIEEYYNGDIPWITPKDLSGYDRKFIKSGSRSITQLGLDKSSAKVLPKGSVLFSSRAPIGYISIAENDVTTNQGFKSIDCSEGKISNNYVYYTLVNQVEDIKNNATGSTFKEVSGLFMKKIKLIVPNEAVLNKYEAIITDNDLVLKKNYREIDILTDLRDILLPKLMSGKIRVSINN